MKDCVYVVSKLPTFLEPKMSISYEALLIQRHKQSYASIEKKSNTRIKWVLIMSIFSDKIRESFSLYKKMKKFIML